jgi:ERCC4-type nuclease
METAPDSPNGVVITVDMRENRLIDELRRIVALSGQESHISLAVSPLDVADIAITAGSVNLLFERKTGADLAASLKDGRYREQKKRMGDATSPCHVTYIIENKASCTLSKTVFDGILINTMYRDKMHMIFTSNVQETAVWILTVATKVLADPTKFAHQESGGDGGAYIDYVKVKSRRSDNIDVRTCYLLQLGQIPGVSTRIATAIADVYGNMYALMKALHESPDPVKQLSKIPLIGDKKAKIIMSYLSIATPDKLESP